MQELKRILEANLEQATFRTSIAGDIPQGKMREILQRDGWPLDTETYIARSAKPVVPEELISHLVDHIRDFLKDHVNPNNDSIGHTFPAGGPPSIYVLQEDGLVGAVWVSPIMIFARSLIKGAAVLGTGIVARLLSGWLQTQKVEYRSRAVLNSYPVQRPIQLENGISIEQLPPSTDKLPANLPRNIGIPAEAYIDRTMLSFECTASPAFFRPQPDESAPGVQWASNLDVDLTTFGQALSLETDSHVSPAFFWNDFQDFYAFSLFDGVAHGFVTDFGVKNRSYTVLNRPRPLEGVTSLVPIGEIPVLQVVPEKLSLTLSRLKVGGSIKAKLATERWVASKDFEKSPIDQFIDLRIALESLYLQDFLNEQSQEMRFRLALFGAWHLGVDFEDRKKIRKKLRDAYDTASGAVHGGNLENTPEIQRLLSEAQDLCRLGILKVLSEGYPSQEFWGDLILGGESDEQQC